MNYILTAIFLLISFLIGSLPTAFIVVKLVNGKDLRKVGSGNIGGTNAKRAAENTREKYIIYISTAIIDILKGTLPVVAAIEISKFYTFPIHRDIFLCLTAIFSIIGHDTMPFIKNGRGKGVATTAGAFVPIAPIPVLVGLVTFVGLRALTRTASRRSITAGIAIALTGMLMNYSVYIKISLIFIAALVIYTHRENIQRILKGEE